VCVCVHCNLMCGQDKQTIRLATHYTILYVIAKNKFIEKRCLFMSIPIHGTRENLSNSPDGLAISDINSRQIVRVQLALRGHV
jgi:hypothetical protein